VAVEERNLFNRKMKNERLENRSFFKLHYFPEIPITSSPEKREGTGQSGRFIPKMVDLTEVCLIDLQEIENIQEI
jgi:hypothetical protein